MPSNDRSPSAALPASGGCLFAAGMLLGAPLAVAGSWIAYSNFVVDHQVPLPPAIEAERVTFDSAAAGQLSYYADRAAAGRPRGRPLLLIHSVNAAASAYEMRPIFDHFRGQRPVYALDLPGYGFSERTDRAQSPEAYAQAIVDVIAQQIGEPVDAIALSLGGEFAARAALQQPDFFHSLTLISPSGFNPAGEGRSTQRAVQAGRADSAYRALANPLWGRALFDLIATRRSIEFFLKQSFVGAVPPALIDYSYATAHQPGAHYTPLRFIGGLLFTRDARQELYECLTLPVLVVYDRDAFVRFDALPEFSAAHANWQTARLEPTLGLPQFEAMPRLAASLEEFWARL
jgi:pimeloyl-ACP methyl ester carboxylesterase